MRVVIGGINHETSTFTPIPTNWENYHEHFFLQGQEIIDTLNDTNTPIGGFIEGAKVHGFEAIPTVFGEPHPSAPTERAVFDELLQMLLGGITQAGVIDGVLLDLHGSMVVGNLDGPEAIFDADEHILAAVRDAVGPKIPIVVQLDIHSNVTEQMVEMADVLIGRETYPEIDMAERGRECAEVLWRMCQEGLRPTMALHRMPMIWGLNQATEHPPMREAIAELHKIEAQPGVVCASIATGFYLSDVPAMGSSVHVVTDNDQALAQHHADALGAWIFERRADWQLSLPSTHEALSIAKAAGNYPVIFADTNDNTGGGSPGDSTGVLRTFVEANLTNACLLYIVDLESIALCHQAGVGAMLDLQVGGKSDPLQGPPIPMTVEVMALSDGHFRYQGPMYAGLESTMGPSVYIRQGGIHVILVSQREQPYDPAFAQSMGLDPRTMRYLGLKSTAHFRSGFESWAGAVHVVSEPSIHDMASLTYHRLGHKVYPIDPM